MRTFFTKKEIGNKTLKYNNGFKVFVICLLFTFLFSTSLFPEARYIYRIPWHETGKWVIGDTHIHSIHSDGAYTLDEVAKNAQKYRCDFIAFTNHHVSVPQDELDAVRLNNPGLLIFQGTEWSMPAGEHCCIIIPKDPEETTYTNEFLNNFGREKAPHKPNTETDSEAALMWLDKHSIGGLKPIAIINHPSRRNAYSYDEVYKYLKTGDVLIGFSGAPGHQSFDSYYNTIDGWDNVYAQVGNLVDMLLNKGIKVLAARAPSDFHGDRSDYWPGEYSRTHIYVKDRTHNSIIEGFRAGAAFADHDNICDKVEFTMNTGKLTDIIPGEIILVDKGDDVNVTIKIQPNSSVVFDEIQFISNKNKVPEISKVFKSNNDIETIIPFDAVWKYLFPEKSPRNWQKANFNDSKWERGIGLFGYGYSVINTVVSKDITDPFNRGRESIPKEYPVTYFRNHFNIENYDLINDFFVDMRYSDGFVMYINGKEALRKNMPDGKIDYKTSAVNVQGGGLVTYPVSKKYIEKGMNIIAVGLYQFNDKVKSSNMKYPKRRDGRYNAKFGLQLRGLLNKKSIPGWSANNGWIEMKREYKNLKNDFYVRARGRTSVPYKKWFYTNPILVKVRN